jgi:thioredoxin 1
MGNFNDLINSEKPTLVDFYATWCGPCKILAPMLEEIAGEIGDIAKIIKVDVDTNTDATKKYGIRNVPTLLLFKEGEIVWRQSGVSDKKTIIENIKKFV